jgi:hypothetical protein
VIFFFSDLMRRVFLILLFLALALAGPSTNGMDAMEMIGHLLKTFGATQIKADSTNAPQPVTMEVHKDPLTLNDLVPIADAVSLSKRSRAELRRILLPDVYDFVYHTAGSAIQSRLDHESVGAFEPFPPRFPAVPFLGDYTQRALDYTALLRLDNAMNLISKQVFGTNIQTRNHECVAVIQSVVTLLNKADFNSLQLIPNEDYCATVIRHGMCNFAVSAAAALANIASDIEPQLDLTYHLRDAPELEFAFKTLPRLIFVDRTRFNPYRGMLVFEHLLAAAGTIKRYIISRVWRMDSELFTVPKRDDYAGEWGKLVLKMRHHLVVEIEKWKSKDEKQALPEDVFLAENIAWMEADGDVRETVKDLGLETLVDLINAFQAFHCMRGDDAT